MLSALWPQWEGICRPPELGSSAAPTAERSIDRKSTRLNSSHLVISYAVFCLKKKTHCRPARLRRLHPTKFHTRQIIPKTPNRHHNAALPVHAPELLGPLARRHAAGL